MFDGVLARGRVPEAVADDAWLRAMLDAEAALAKARGQSELAEAVAAAGAGLDPRELGARAAESGNPVVPLVAALREQAGPEVHRGATSQDIRCRQVEALRARGRDDVRGVAGQEQTAVAHRCGHEAAHRVHESTPGS